MWGGWVKSKKKLDGDRHWTHLQTTTWQWLCYSPDMDRPEGKKQRGRPKTTWRRTVEKERSKAEWQSWREVRTAAQDRNRWRAHVEALYANLAPGDKWSEDWSHQRQHAKKPARNWGSRGDCTPEPDSISDQTSVVPNRTSSSTNLPPNCKAFQSVSIPTSGNSKEYKNELSESSDSTPKHTPTGFFKLYKTAIFLRTTSWQDIAILMYKVKSDLFPDYTAELSV